jgi:hypothetical protein
LPLILQLNYKRTSAEQLRDNSDDRLVAAARSRFDFLPGGVPCYIINVQINEATLFPAKCNNSLVFAFEIKLVFEKSSWSTHDDLPSPSRTGSTRTRQGSLPSR